MLMNFTGAVLMSQRTTGQTCPSYFSNHVLPAVLGGGDATAFELELAVAGGVFKTELPSSCDPRSGGVDDDLELPAKENVLRTELPRFSGFPT